MILVHFCAVTFLSASIRVLHLISIVGLSSLPQGGNEPIKRSRELELTSVTFSVEESFAPGKDVQIGLGCMFSSGFQSLSASPIKQAGVKQVQRQVWPLSGISLAVGNLHWETLFVMLVRACRKPVPKVPWKLWWWIPHCLIQSSTQRELTDGTQRKLWYCRRSASGLV